MKYIFIGYIAAILTALSTIPLFRNTVINKITDRISYFYVSIILLAQALWLIYGFVNNDTPLIFLSIFLFVVFSIIGLTKYRFEF